VREEEAAIMARLDDALSGVSEALEAALQAAEPRGDGPYVVLGNPAEANAKYGETSKGRVLVTLAGLRAGAEGRPTLPGRAGVRRQPTIGLEADLLVTTDFPGQYPKGVRIMTVTLDWVQDNPVLTAGDAVDADRFTIEFADLGFEEAAALVHMAGVKGCPFTLLRLRGLSAGSQAES
jgi:hypothetical protein